MVRAIIESLAEIASLATFSAMVAVFALAMTPVT
jgi:hypothetical protein